VILLSEVERLGKKGEVVSVKRGHARNLLIPRKWAAYDTEQNRLRYASLLATLQAESPAAAAAPLEAQARAGVVSTTQVSA
jgi:ribosomal protein L9